MWFFPGFGIRPGRRVTWSKVLQVLRTRGSIKLCKQLASTVSRTGGKSTPSLPVNPFAYYSLWSEIVATLRYRKFF